VEWGDSRYYTVDLEGELRLRELLTHLYVLVPVLDAEKHYWVGDAEVEKLLRRGEGWLPGHPERELIVNRYLKYRRSLTSDRSRSCSQTRIPIPTVSRRLARSRRRRSRSRFA
jgi:hypothetical protein